MKRSPLKRRTELRRKRSTPRRRRTMLGVPRCSWPFSRCRSLRLAVVVSPTEAYCTSHGVEIADTLVSLFIRGRDRRCQHCGAGEDLEAAHIVGRGARYIRFDEDDLLALCHSCHSYFTNHPVRFRAFIDARHPGLITRLIHREAAGERAGGHVDVAAVILEMRSKVAA